MFTTATVAKAVAPLYKVRDNLKKVVAAQMDAESGYLEAIDTLEDKLNAAADEWKKAEKLLKKFDELLA